jgi:hypothetical protein
VENGIHLGDNCVVYLADFAPPPFHLRSTVLAQSPRGRGRHLHRVGAAGIRIIGRPRPSSQPPSASERIIEDEDDFPPSYEKVLCIENNGILVYFKELTRRSIEIMWLLAVVTGLFFSFIYLKQFFIDLTAQFIDRRLL